MKKDKKKESNQYFAELFIIYVCLIVFSAICMVVGFHNFDLGHNIKYVNCMQDDYTFFDITSAGITASPHELISSGVGYMLGGFFVLVYSLVFVSFIVGVILGRFKLK